MWILGRAKRFAKIGAEIVSLAAVEELVQRTWPGVRHTVVSLPDTHMGEQIVMLTEYRTATRQALVERFRLEGVSTLMLPKTILFVQVIPLLANGKIDYPAARALAEKQLAR